jgi:hypothetical protein
MFPLFQEDKIKGNTVGSIFTSSVETIWNRIWEGESLSYFPLSININACGDIKIDITENCINGI